MSNHDKPAAPDPAPCQHLKLDEHDSCISCGAEIGIGLTPKESNLSLTRERVEEWLHASTHMDCWTCATPDPESAAIILIEPEELEKLSRQALRAIEQRDMVLAWLGRYRDSITPSAVAQLQDILGAPK